MCWTGVISEAISKLNYGINLKKIRRLYFGSLLLTLVLARGVLFSALLSVLGHCHLIYHPHSMSTGCSERSHTHVGGTGAAGGGQSSDGK